MLENYHAAALRAHKAHGGLDTVIPVPLPPPPVDAAPAPVPTIRPVRDEEPPPGS